MKKRLCVLGFTLGIMAVSCVLLFGQASSSSAHQLYGQTQARHTTHLQERVDSAFYRSVRTRNARNLRHLIDSLEEQYHQTHQSIWAYWVAYATYELSIYEMVNDSHQRAKRSILTAIRCLDTLDDKNAEVWALLSVMTGYSITFRWWAASWLGPRAIDYAEKAVALDSQNIRAWYALLVNDFYTPALFGGGKMVDYYGRRALRCPDQVLPNPYLPSWGRAETYDLLIRWHLRQKRTNSAQELFEEASCQVGPHPLLTRLQREYSTILSK